MNLNQPPLEELSEYSATHYSVMGSIHPVSTHESTEEHVGGSCGVSKSMPDWLAQLVRRLVIPNEP